MYVHPYVDRRRWGRGGVVEVCGGGGEFVDDDWSGNNNRYYSTVGGWGGVVGRIQQQNGAVVGGFLEILEPCDNTQSDHVNKWVGFFRLFCFLLLFSALFFIIERKKTAARKTEFFCY